MTNFNKARIFAIIISTALCCSASAALSADDVQSVKDARKQLFDAAAEASKKAAKLTFEEFKAQTYREPGEDGKFIVGGDTPIANEKLLKQFFVEMQKEVAEKLEQADEPELSVITVGGLDAVWSSSEKRNLTYCVSTDFANDYATVVAAMDQATRAWEAVADIDYIHVSSQDAGCNQFNSNVTFDIRPTFGSRYLARAFFPNDGRRHRNVLINDSSFQLNPNGRLSLAGIMRHELGHTLGLRHEHTRPEAGTCFEDSNWRPLTIYDAFSTMHYPQCNGQGDWSLRLTELDKHGVACLYGASAGFNHDPSRCLGMKPTGTVVKTVTYENITVEQNADWRPDGILKVIGGSRFVARMTGAGDNPGDPDLYVKFDALADPATYDCRPYDTGAEEECIVDVPQSATKASIMVNGYEAGSFSLSVTFETDQE